MNLKALFLPIGLIVAVAVALALPAPGVWLKDNGAIPWFIVTIFLVNGYQLKTSEAKFSNKLLLTVGIAVVISLVAGPLIGTGLGKVMGLSAAFAMGLVIMSAVPSTLSSGIVITGVAGGNTAWAMYLTIILNGLGVLVIPFSLKFCLATGADISIDPLPLLAKLCLLVILPFLVGLGIRRGTGKFDWNRWLTYIPSTCVILTVLAGLSSSRETVLGMPPKQFPLIILAVVMVHVILLLLTIPGAKLIGLVPSEAKALTFVASQKTLPIAISVLASIGGETGSALIVCLIFHFSQLLLDSWIAARMAGKRVK